MIHNRWCKINKIKIVDVILDFLDQNWKKAIKINIKYLYINIYIIFIFFNNYEKFIRKTLIYNKL